MVTMGGGSIGFQAGVQAADIVLVFKTPQSLTNILGGQKVTLGADASVAVGPVGRQANAATDARLGAEIYSYARSRGLFLGVSLGGADLSVDHNADGALYGRYGVSPADVFNSNGITIRPEVQQLVADLNAKSGVQPSTQPSVLPVGSPGVHPSFTKSSSATFLSGTTTNSTNTAAFLSQSVETRRIHFTWISVQQSQAGTFVADSF